MRLTDTCQRLNIIGKHPLMRRFRHRWRYSIHVRTQLRRIFAQPSGVGAPSRFAEGQWVQVLSREAIQGALDAQGQCRGLQFLPYQWVYCCGVYQAQKIVRSLIDDEGIFRSVHRTILLKGVHCGEFPNGCGRACPLMFRDERVVPAPSPAPALSSVTEPGSYVRVRSAEEIRATLDRCEQRDGLMFMPEMYRWVGMRFRVA